jgi:fructokinase
MILSCGEALIDMVPGAVSGAAKGVVEDHRDCFFSCPGGSPYNTAIAIGRLRQVGTVFRETFDRFFGRYPD